MLNGRRRVSNLIIWRLNIARKAQPGVKAPTIDSQNISSSNESTSNNDEKSTGVGKNVLTLKSFTDLTKFRLSQYNTLASYSMYLYYVPGFMAYESLVFLVATQLITMSSQAYNQTVESDFDKNMRRTQNRPVAKGMISKQTGGLISAGLALSSFAIYIQLANPIAILVANSIWIGYWLVYTPLKRVSVHNTLVGAIIGALPPFIGTAAAIGSIFTPETILFSAYIFSWQYPHFYGILYENRFDYKNAGYEMISNYDKDGVKATKHIKLSAILALSTPLGMAYTGLMSPVFLPAYYYLYMHNLKAVKEFSDNWNEQNAKKMKMKSYTPFFWILLGIYSTIIYNKIKNRSIKQVETD
jgi:protoheme IX farnesyltransferase